MGGWVDLSVDLFLTRPPTPRNIVVPAQAIGSPVQVISAMYHKSPLGLGLLPSSKAHSLKELAQREIRVGMLSDSITLAQKLLHQAAGSKR